MFRNLYPNDARIQALTWKNFEELGSCAEVNWKNLTSIYPPAGLVDPFPSIATGPPTLAQIDNCGYFTAFVVFDIICIVLNGVLLRGSVNAGTIFNIAGVVQRYVPRLAPIMGRMLVFLQRNQLLNAIAEMINVLREIVSSGLLGSVLGAFLGGLTWDRAILYGVQAAATIALAVSTGGTALYAQYAITLASAGFLLVDIQALVTAIHLGCPACPCPHLP